MDFTEYQAKARETAVYPVEYALVYPLLGEVDEASEACEKLMNCLWPDGNISKAHYPLYTVLSMITNVGKVVGKVKKQIRDNGGLLTKEGEQSLAELVKKNILDNPQRVKEMSKECPGDTLWYCAAVATDLNVELGSTAEENIVKLLDRLQRGKIHGSGDQR
jgi:NTP pyrophosphatase (non-canonical NTP hydrolase)